MEEERRLGYVGITRAEQELYLTHAQMRTLYGRTTMNPPSRFLAEIQADLIESDEPVRTDNRSFATFTSYDGGKACCSTERCILSADWRVGSKVEHGKWGQGTVVSIKGQGDGLELDIAFSSQGIKKLLAKFAPIKKL